MQRISTITVMALTLVTCGRDSLAQELTQTDPRFPIAELKNDLPELATIVDHLGKSETEQASVLIAGRTHVGDPSRVTESDAIERRQVVQRELRIFEQVPFQFDSIDYVGIRPISNQAGIVHLVGNGKTGPVLFRFQVFRHSGDWRLVGFDFHSNFQRIQEIVEPHQFANPYTIPVSSMTTGNRLAEKPDGTESK